MRHELGLLENALDSLNEALRKFQAGENGDARSYKFAVLHFAHSLELLFKFYVTQSHPLLIYKNPFSKNIEKENTISLWDAVQFLKNEGKNISADLSKDLEWVKQLRNNIEHHKFEMNVHDVRKALGRLIRATMEFSDEHDLLDLAEKVEPDCKNTFDTLADEYRASIAAARAEALDKSDDGEAYDCAHCGERGTAALIEEKYECLFCKETVSIVECCVCGDDFPETEVSVWNDDHLPHIDYICEACESHISGD
jgi:hypothetical protein